MIETYRLPNGELVDSSYLVGTVDHDASLPTWQEYQDWLKAMSQPLTKDQLNEPTR